MPAIKALATIALALAATPMATTVTHAQGVGVAPGGSTANTTGIGSGLGDPRGTGPHYPNGTTQPVLPPPPPPGGYNPSLPPVPSFSTSSRPPSYPQPTAPFGPPVSGPSTSGASLPALALPAAPVSDLSFLKGCWRTDVFQYSNQPGVSTYCFDAQGRGRFLYKRLNQPDYACQATAQADYVGPQLRFHTSNMTCSDGRSAYPANLDCAGGGSGEAAQCTSTAETQAGAETWSVHLRRIR
ncbi:hypothetical protein SAMN02745126_06298 [Enhydrobacter aerosaccus]|uniref:Uncharacterized protein n=1 Tax=Enhydrobacter aerosaccus TaxID=225324 RepID=A0A1T4THR0_9HYPH|nr:hypothetical protein [Enhydrobacter aerosaccus]SKA39993.1 hypothetical protein SAMN02745126_06298 [Enhydrobacter aerosaccus]